MDKEILATINSFRSASLVFSSPENLAFLVPYSACSYTYLHVVTSRTVIKCNRREFRMKFLAHAQTVGTRLYFPPPHNFYGYVNHVVITWGNDNTLESICIGVFNFIGVFYSIQHVIY